MSAALVLAILLTQLVLLALLAGGAGTEAVLRHLVARRTLALLGRVVATPDGAAVTLPEGRLAPALLRGRLAAATITAPTVRLGDLPVHDVVLHLQDVLVGPRLQLLGGTGVLEGHLTGAEVRRRAGAPPRVRLEGGRAAISVAGLSIGLRPVVDGDRVRLAPTPFSLSLPPLPPGVALVAVDTADDTLRITAHIEFARLLTSRRRE
jgi:hypothetical protein